MEWELDREDFQIIVPRAFAEKLEQALESYAYVFITAHTGWGKTSVVKEFLRDTPHTFVSLWEQEALRQASSDTTGMIVLDDFQAIYDYKDKADAVLTLLRTLPADTRCILLSRADIPETLLPFLETGQMLHMPYSSLALDTREIQRLLEMVGDPVPSQEGLDYLLALTQGNPELIIAVGGYLEDNTLTQTALEQSRELFYSFLDRHLFRYWDPMEQRLLMLASFFESFTIDMARILTGDPDVETIIERLRQTGSYLLRDGDTCAFRFPMMNRYLQFKVSQVYRREEDLQGIYLVLSLCCRISGDLSSAVSYSIKAKDPIRTTELLTAFIRNHPKEGIQTLAHCYQQIPEYDREYTPELMCGMSMIRSWGWLLEESEQYLESLKTYGSGIYGGGKPSQTARGLAAYLMLHLPHWNNSQRAEVLQEITEGQEQGSLRLPEFSITDGQPSVLRGLWDMSDWMAEEHPYFQQLIAQQYGRTAPDILRLLKTERAYERGCCPWERVAELASMQANSTDRENMDIELAAIALAARIVCTQDTQEELSLAFSVTANIQRRIAEKGLTQLSPYADALVCRVSLRGDCAYADEWYEQKSSMRAELSTQNRYLCLTWARCCIRHQAYRACQVQLNQLIERLNVQNRTLDAIEALLLSAICLRCMNPAGDAWKEALTKGMALAQPYGYTALFAELGAAILPLLKEITWKEHRDYLAQLRQAAGRQAKRYPGYLAPFNAATARKPSLSAELLTEQERVLFRHICLNHSNEQIRNLMGLSVNQLTKLANGLYAKLQTRSRKRIREMGVILGNTDS